MLNRLNRYKKKGFTLVELIVVLVILAILAAIAIPSFSSYIDKAKRVKVTEEIRAVVTALDIAMIDTYAEHNVDVEDNMIYYSSAGGSVVSNFEQVLIENLKNNLSETDFEKITSFVIRLSTANSNSSVDIEALGLYYTTESGETYTYERKDGKETITKR